MTYECVTVQVRLCNRTILATPAGGPPLTGPTITPTAAKAGSWQTLLQGQPIARQISRTG